MPDEFKPIFNQYVYVNNPDGSQTRVNPEHCLYPNSAWELSLLLGKNGYPCTIVPGPANKGFGDGNLFGIGFSETSTVPWLQFAGANGLVQERAGELASNWIRATNDDTGVTDQKTALRNAITEVKNLIAGN